ncbi:MAG: 4-alpha-glucanotransferase [Ghiorsea sp.]
MNQWIDHRRSAVLLHITSLPGPFHKGVLGKEAFEFVDAMLSGGFTVWQFLPLGPTHSHGSPYESLSTFAGNPELIDLRDCVTSGWLDASVLKGDLSSKSHAKHRINTAQDFWSALKTDSTLKESVEAFQQQHAHWLEDFSLFTALKSATNNQAWWQWSKGLRERDSKAMNNAKSEHQTLIQQVIFEQFIFDRQWKSLKAYAEDKGVQLFGDLPIYVAHDSADVWSNQSFFTVNEQGLCDEVAGVPADYFSKTGQRWGNPLYRWETMKQDGFNWWTKRVSRQLELMHMLRIDHFLALNAFWVIPGESENGLIGKWRKAPGQAMLQTLKDNLGSLPLIAEDLGTITEEVTALREHFGLPGMKILHFAFGGDDNNPYLPTNHEENGVVYTGTHDNDTTMGWFKSLDKHTKKHALEVLDAQASDMPWAMIEAALASPAQLSVIPMQDLLELDESARFNTPGTLDDSNWSWRLDEMPSPNSSCWKKSQLLNQKHLR